MSRFALLLLVALVSCSPGQDAEPELVAIDVLLDPEPSMAAFSVAANERLRENYPAGFALGAGHAPHITLGLAEPPFLDSLLGQPFPPISFTPESVSIYQLGDLGTAQRKLWPRD